ncbi:undecaprenyl-diphosphate phosphatase [Sulfitobacter pseudonitzschiae]|uniref:Undecaprenyl-diphosphatase n=1 Tax=Pseudosulfitobacter pseudonitzschiae TaxID=1402135 RepID=A0A9Q2NX50_9RHOB|nr:undecaprenyl-diphosphate phosphatase [Pseudosulfitobacter pseudonitzschiae]MBM2290754.1 undecaprenyl-diphosphate phosphatase [Pseudosulfitobacter pseudonitzschiae]MBM2295672.1 undecaprenyl-diphosphate phosphatase [Pseudosulfitobacter pseudonitzschiae]MBM2300584.1 undecaprenyl-diphosphate phosphatase [Pseudosulfitobacter pseudonitzschiae]MBM2310369.1 undecaprenyl-diphosphate phosphatase [Pseudosulfitobacter pseudonitzschiae]MBM2315281.1 undecaprenyl-diphosphate phosphatase [Pseudosulfitobact|tara:strand:+ start:2197 stop:3000 length:804 start_codon:yes stop_codon:yes gene_type:complete
MSLYYLLIAAVIQGITEFLPISSSGHLILLPALSGAQDQGLAIDVAVHVGTLLAVILYFWRDVRSALVGLGRLARGKVDTPGAMLAFLLILSTVPVMIVGLAIKLAGLDEAMRSVAVIGWAMLGFGIVLYWADRTGATTKAKDDWTLKDAVAMGLAQVIALIPGTSRSGITITAARKLGYDRESAATLSMLMSIPTIIASGVLLGADVVGQANWALARDGGIAAAFAFVAALLSLKLMMKLLKSVDFTPYVIYRIIFGLFLLWWAYS